MWDDCPVCGRIPFRPIHSPPKRGKTYSTTVPPMGGEEGVTCPFGSAVMDREKLPDCHTEDCGKKAGWVFDGGEAGSYNFCWDHLVLPPSHPAIERIDGVTE